MRKDQIIIGHNYMMKVNGRVVPVRVDSINSYGHYGVTNMVTGRETYARSAAKFRAACPDLTLALRFCEVVGGSIGYLCEHGLLTQARLDKIMEHRAAANARAQSGDPLNEPAITSDPLDQHVP